MQIKFYLKHEKMVNMIQLVSKGKKQGQTLNYCETYYSLMNILF